MLKHFYILVIIALAFVPFILTAQAYNQYQDDIRKNDIISLHESFYFKDNNTTELNSEIKSYLNSLAKYLIENKNYSVVVTCSSDKNLSIEEQNRISELRFQEVSIYLINKGIKQSRITEGENKNPNSGSIVSQNSNLKNNRIDFLVMDFKSISNEIKELGSNKKNPIVIESENKVIQEIEPNEEHHHEIHPNHLAIFAGPSYNCYSKKTYFALGLDYERRLPFWDKIFGIGLFGEITFVDKNAYSFGGLIFAHPIGGWKIYAGAGAEIAKITVYKSIGTEGEIETETEAEHEFLLRVGTGYDFHLGNFSLSPTCNVDYVNLHTIIIYGLSLGIGF